MSDSTQDLFPLNGILTEVGIKPLSDDVFAQFGAYLALLLRWNARLNLTAIRDQEGILSRHFVESIACARLLPAGIRTLLDYGSGGGFPGIPIALCRPEVAVTLAESQGKKAAFLREAVRVLGLQTKIHSARAEGLSERFDCVTLRAVDRMAVAVSSASFLVAPGGWLCLLTTRSDLEGLSRECGDGFKWETPTALPGAEMRVVGLARRECEVLT